MISDAAWRLQIACQQRLNGDPQLIQIIGIDGVFDEPPRHRDLPYVTVHVERGADWSTSTEEGGEYTILVRAWSAYQGRQEVLEIGAAIEQALLQAPLNLTNYRVINLRMQTAQTGQEQDGRSYLSVLTFRAVVEPV